MLEFLKNLGMGGWAIVIIGGIILGIGLVELYNYVDRKMKE